MANRSQVPRGVERGKGKPVSEKELEKSKLPMRFRNGRSKRPDTGKKISKYPSRSPNPK